MFRRGFVMSLLSLVLCTVLLCAVPVISAAEQELCTWYSHVLCAQEYDLPSLYEHGEAERELIAGAILGEALADEYAYMDCIPMADVVKAAVENGSVYIGQRTSDKKLLVLAFDGQNRMVVCTVPVQYGEKIKSEWKIDYDLEGKKPDDVVRQWRSKNLLNTSQLVSGRKTLKQMTDMAEKGDYEAVCAELLSYVREQMNATAAREEAEAKARRVNVRVKSNTNIRDENGNFVVQASSGKDITVAGYSAALDKFSVEYDGKAGYLSGDDLRWQKGDKWVDVSKNELKSYFEYKPIRKHSGK